MTVDPIEPGSEVPEAGSGAAGEEALPPELEAPAPELPFLIRLWRGVRGWLAGFALVFLAIVVAEIFKGPMARFEAFLARHHGAVQWSLIGATAGGLLLFVAAAIYLGRHGVSMGPEEVEEMLRKNRETMAGPAAYRRWRYSFYGKSAGRGFDVEISFRQLKEVLRQPGWWRDPTSLSLLAAVAGGLLMVFGGLSLFVFYGPPWLKVLIGGWMLYALVRMTWGLVRA